MTEQEIEDYFNALKLLEFKDVYVKTYFSEKDFVKIKDRILEKYNICYLEEQSEESIVVEVRTGKKCSHWTKLYG